MSALTVQVGDRDLTGTHEGLSYSNVDPGGNEVCQLNPADVQGIRPGAAVTVRHGLQVAWHGRLNEPGQHAQGDRTQSTLGAVGYAAALKDRPYAEIYCDRDFGRWQGPGTQRQNNVAGSNFAPTGPQSTPDATTGAPSLQLAANGDWAATGLPLCEGWYDGQGVAIGSLAYAWQKGASVQNADTNWSWKAFLSSDDLASTTDASAQLRAAGPGTGTVTATGTRRFALAQLQYGAAGGTAGVLWPLYWTVLAVYGTHGVPQRGSLTATDAPGFYPSDVALDALRRSGAGICPGVVEQATGLIVRHLVYPAPTEPDKIIDDMARLLGWHWGVWEPRTALDSQPTFHFRAPPAEATCVVSRADCVELDPPKVRLDLLYDTAKVSYTDPAGSRGTVTVTLANPLLSEAGIGSRTLALDMGQGSSGTATLFGQYALLLSQRTARGGGYAILPGDVTLPGGGTRPACLLKAGRDRIRITDLPDSGPIHETDTRRFDSFHVRRVEVTIENGVPRTRVDFDGGADLMEVLQARLAVQVPLG